MNDCGHHLVTVSIRVGAVGQASLDPRWVTTQNAEQVEVGHRFFASERTIGRVESRRNVIPFVSELATIHDGGLSRLVYGCRPD